jgi:uncharacterized membrane protein
VLGRHLPRTLAEVNARHLLSDLLDLAVKYRIRVPREYALLSRASISMEGILRQLSPDLDIVGVALPYAKELLKGRYEVGDLQGGLLRALLRFQGLAADLPTQLSQILLDLETGRFNVHVRSTTLDQMNSSLRAAAVITFLGLCACGFIVGAFISFAQVPWTVRGYPVLGLLGTAGAAALFGAAFTWYLLRQSLREDQPAPPPPRQGPRRSLIRRYRFPVQRPQQPSIAHHLEGPRFLAGAPLGGGMDVSTRVVTALRTVPIERSRLLPVDWLRGLVMVLMTIDHASSSFNAGRLFGDSAKGWVPGTELPAVQFLTRWITHLCAPTFLFLAGYSLFISVQRRKREDAAEADITRSIAGRGLLIAALDPLWMVFVHRGEWVLQVLYAIGVSMMAMSVLRRLPAPICGALGLLLVVLHEGLATAFAHAEGVGRILLVLTLVPGRVGPFPVWYPVLPWLAVMLLGWAAADVARRDPAAFQTRLLLAGLGALAVFAVVRGLDGYGNWGCFATMGRSSSGSTPRSTRRASRISPASSASPGSCSRRCGRRTCRPGRAPH